MSQRNDRPSSPTPEGRPTRPNEKSATPPPYMQPPTYRSRPQSPTYRARPTTGPQPVQRLDAQSRVLAARYRTEARRNRMRFIVLALVAIMLLGGIATYAYVSNVVKDVTDAWNDIFKPPPPTRPDINGTPVVVDYPDWGKEPVNILLIGLDLREDEKDTRADTQILVHVDPVGKSAAMVSIPRDLFVPIPGFGEDRINSSFQLGENNIADIPGGGPALTMATVETNFGVPVHYYAQVDFTGFERVIDALGGLTIDVPKPLVDNEYPLGNYGVTRLYVPAGLQHMDGRTSLAYARSRHADSDIGRNLRQQQVLLAIRQQGLNLNLLTKLQDLARSLKGAVQTDLSPVQIGSLAKLAQEIDRDSIQTLAIDANMVTETRLADGRLVLVPNWDIIKPKIAQAFADPRLAKEAARLSVQNGTTTGGIGKKVRDDLAAQGFFIPDLRSAPDQGSYPVTEITDFTGGQKPRTLEALCSALELDCTQVKQGDPAGAPVAQTDGLPVDIMIIAGDDMVDK